MIPLFPLTPAAKESRQNRAGKGTMKIVLVMAIIGGIIPFGVPTLLICAGLLPTLVALFTDTDPDKSSTATIGFMNLAGVLPFLVDLWKKGQTMDVAIVILREPRTWLIMFGAAAIGHLLLFIIPPIMTSMTISRMESRLSSLKEGLEQLRAIWGPEVATTLPIDQVRKNMK